MEFLKMLLCGAVVGVANIIPGVSGGTMAVVLNIYDRLIEKYPSLMTVRPTDPRLREESYRASLIAVASGSKILAIGPMAAWVYDTPHFVNQIEDDGCYGHNGVNALFEKMKDAFDNPKDIQRIVSRKALGCCC